MSVRLKGIKSNLKQIDAHKIGSDEYDELPELTDEMFSRAVYKVKGKEQISPRQRGKQKAATKVPVNIRLPLEVVDYFKAGGSGWQTKISDILKNWVKAHSHDHRKYPD